ncbi:MAG: DUF4282 domain-containing protein [Firmicutes bacterium]|nr:DUF4282 domain-containing protein [Bacillota bacterium]
MQSLEDPEGRGFFDSLFDFSFRTFVTDNIIRILYLIAIVVAGLVGIAEIVRGFSSGIGIGLFTLIILAPLSFFLMILYARVVLELIMVVFRIEQEMTKSRMQIDEIAARLQGAGDHPTPPSSLQEPFS